MHHFRLRVEYIDFSNSYYIYFLNTFKNNLENARLNIKIII